MAPSASGMGRAVVGVALVVFMALCAGCHSPFTTIAPEVSLGAEKLGRAHGQSTSAIAGIGHWTAYQFIPIGWSERNQEAYDRALASVPGATALGGVTIQEDYFFWVFWWSRTLKIDGEGVR